jgi:hypothetical protein
MTTKWVLDKSSLLGLSILVAVIVIGQFLPASVFTKDKRGIPCQGLKLASGSGQAVTMIVECGDHRVHRSLDASLIIARATTTDSMPLVCTTYKYRETVECLSAK